MIKKLGRRRYFYQMAYVKDYGDYLPVLRNKYGEIIAYREYNIKKGKFETIKVTKYD